MNDFDVIIIGAGISGLAAANYLISTDLKVKVLESEAEVGGRVRSLHENGFIMDRGFQVFLPSYPEAKKLLNYDKLNLKYFKSGSYILSEDGGFYLVDPMSDFSLAIKTLFNSNLSLGDKLKLFSLKSDLQTKSIGQIFSSEVSTRQGLSNRSFSKQLVDKFFQPFLAGIFFEKALSTSEAMFEFVIKMFNEKSAAIPAKGMGEISKQLYDNLPPGQVELNTWVKNVKQGEVLLSNGEKYTAKSIVLATEGNSSLLKDLEIKNNQGYVSTQCFYYELEKAPSKEPLLILNSNKDSLINNLCFISNISNELAPKGKSLLSVTVLSQEKEFNESDVKEELKTYFGIDVQNWKLLKSMDIPYALPKQIQVRNSRPENEINPKKGIYLAGDYNLYGSLNAAMQSGREVAELIIKNQEQ